MRVYKIGTHYIDLDHVLSITEPRMRSSDCGFRDEFVIPIELAFVGPKHIVLDISDEEFIGEKREVYRNELNQVIDPHQTVYTRAYFDFKDAEFMRLKYNVWAPFLTAWQTKDDVSKQYFITAEDLNV